MKKGHLTVLGVAILLLIAVLTNPNSDQHRDAIRSRLNRSLQEQLLKEQSKVKDKWEMAGNALGAMLGGAVIDRLINSSVSSENYILFSTTRINWDGKTHIVGFGVFGNVYLSKRVEDAFGSKFREDQ